jgi:hypothetical protein
VTFGFKLFVVTFAAFAAEGLVVALAALWLERRPRPAAPAMRAGKLFATRLVPTASAVLMAGLTATSFLIFEPHHTSARTGSILLALAFAGAGVFIAGVMRAYRLWRISRRTWTCWIESGVPVDVPLPGIPAYAVESEFPIVAVAGIFRPKLVIANSVLEACTSEELYAILQHERAHMTRADNLRRGAMAAAPDFTPWAGASRRLYREWNAAAELAADDTVFKLGEQVRVNLAQALIRVARLSPRPTCSGEMPSSALYRGEDIETRVRRLVRPAEGLDLPKFRGRFAMLLYVAILSAMMLGVVQQLIEIAATRLP